MQGSQWLVALDAAAFVPTNPLDLSQVKPDFVTLSFYKMFGFPTGIGALLVRNAVVGVMEKVYWGGGTVSMASEIYRFNKFHVENAAIVRRRTGLPASSRTEPSISRRLRALESAWTRCSRSECTPFRSTSLR